MAVAPGLRKICEILQLLWILGSTLALVGTFQGEEEGRKIPETEWAYVQKWMKKTIDDLKGSWLKVTSSMNKVAKSEETKIDEMRKSIKNDVRKEVDRLKKQANDEELDIRECLSEVSDGGEALAKSLLKGAMQCITDEAKKSQKLVSSEEALVKEVKTLWQNARTGWDKCQSSHNVIGCRGKLVAEAETKEDKFTNKEGQLMSEAATLVNKLQSETDYCVTSELASVPAALADTFSTMEKCVKKLHVKKKAD